MSYRQVTPPIRPFAYGKKTWSNPYFPPPDPSYVLVGPALAQQRRKEQRAAPNYNFPPPEHPWASVVSNLTDSMEDVHDYPSPDFLPLSPKRPPTTVYAEKKQLPMPFQTANTAGCKFENNHSFNKASDWDDAMAFLKTPQHSNCGSYHYEATTVSYNTKEDVHEVSLVIGMSTLNIKKRY